MRAPFGFLGARLRECPAPVGPLSDSTNLGIPHGLQHSNNTHGDSCLDSQEIPGRGLGMKSFFVFCFVFQSSWGSFPHSLVVVACLKSGVSLLPVSRETSRSALAETRGHSRARNRSPSRGFGSPRPCRSKRSPPPPGPAAAAPAAPGGNAEPGAPLGGLGGVGGRRGR